MQLNRGLLLGWVIPFVITSAAVAQPVPGPGGGDPALLAAAQAPIPQACTNNLQISQATSTDIKTGTAKLYICSVFIEAADAENVSLVEGTGTVCATNTVALIGSTTAAGGPNLPIGGGWVEVSPTYIFSTSVSANHLCLLQSGTGRVAGHITYSDH